MPKNFKSWARIPEGWTKNPQKRPGTEVVEELQNRGLPARMRVFQPLQSRWKNMPHNKPKREGGRWWSRVALLVVFSNF